MFVRFLRKASLRFYPRGALLAVNTAGLSSSGRLSLLSACCYCLPLEFVFLRCFFTIGVVKLVASLEGNLLSTLGHWVWVGGCLKYSYGTCAGCGWVGAFEDLEARFDLVALEPKWLTCFLGSCAWSFLLLLDLGILAGAPRVLNTQTTTSSTGYGPLEDPTPSDLELLPQAALARARLGAGS